MIIIDIEMPIYCYDCPCYNGENGRCNITGDSTYDKRPFDCPLKEVEKGNIVYQHQDEFNYCPYCGKDLREEKKSDK